LSGWGSEGWVSAEGSVGTAGGLAVLRLLVRPAVGGVRGGGGGGGAVRDGAGAAVVRAAVSGCVGRPDTRGASAALRRVCRLRPIVELPQRLAEDRPDVAVVEELERLAVGVRNAEEERLVRRVEVRSAGWCGHGAEPGNVDCSLHFRLRTTHPRS